MAIVSDAGTKKLVFEQGLVMSKETKSASSSILTLHLHDPLLLHPSRFAIPQQKLLVIDGELLVSHLMCLTVWNQSLIVQQTFANKHSSFN